MYTHTPRDYTHPLYIMVMALTRTIDQVCFQLQIYASMSRTKREIAGACMILDFGC